ncbi:MAG: acyl-CoA dehydrogenase family protein [Thermodesulfobacteriota bacterium]
MSFRDIDILPDETSRAIIKELEKFTATVMRPAAMELDKSHAPAEVFAETSPLWNVFSSFRGLDLHLTGIPEALGGIGHMDAVTSVMMAERLGYADAGLAIGLTAAGTPFCLAAQLQTPAMEALARNFCQDREGRMIGCRSLGRRRKTPAGGNGTGTAGPSPFLSAREDGSDVILSGKLSGIVNAPIATHGAFEVILSPERTGLAVIPLDQPGITRQTPAVVVSQKSAPRGSLRFEAVRVPGECVITEDNTSLAGIRETFTAGLNLFLSGIYAGTARAALDEALRYAKNRVQGGVPIFEHGNIRLQLFTMFKMVEAARAAALRLAGYQDRQGTAGTWPHTVAARCLAVEAACQVTSDAIQVFGGYGLAREFPLEKFFRDARLGLVENGVNEDLAIEAMLEG